MKKIFFVLAMLIGVAYGQTTAYLRYDSVKLAKNGGTTELILENATKATTGGVLVNVLNGRTQFQNYTFQNALTAGSTLTGANIVEVGGFDFTMQNANEILLGSNTGSGFSSSFIAPSNIVLTAANSSSGTTRSSVSIEKDSIIIYPYLGNVHIDILNNASTQDQLMGWTSSGGDRGGVGYITVGSGLSLSSGVLSADVTASSTTTFTNKRWTARVGSTTSSATPTINTDNVDIYKLTAQAADITSFTTNLSGTPVDGDILEIQVTGTAARAITWGASFVSTTVTLPTTTTSTSTLTVVFQYYTTSSYGNNKWHCVNYY